jgi:hypothetical protein
MWVEAAMRAAGLECAPCPEVRGHPWRLIGRHATPTGVADADEAGFSFAFVRHPLEWYRSFWAYRVMLRNFSPSCDGADGQHPMIFPPDLCWIEATDNAGNARAFERFVQRCLETHPDGWVGSLYRCYLGDEGDHLDYVGRQEQLADDLVQALRLAGETFDEGRLRATPRRNRAASMPRFAGQLALSRETAERMLECERWVVEQYYQDKEELCRY